MKVLCFTCTGHQQRLLAASCAAAASEWSCLVQTVHVREAVAGECDDHQQYVIRCSQAAPASVNACKRIPGSLCLSDAQLLWCSRGLGRLVACQRLSGVCMLNFIASTATQLLTGYVALHVFQAVLVVRHL